ncbi:MAG: DUF1838 domain-containing protein [Gammaproteobacteria bacterium]|nr:MAG: DUF1838 domain-containing protein [Gammaproteobacteria bacterium]
MISRRFLLQASATCAAAYSAVAGLFNKVAAAGTHSTRRTPMANYMDKLPPGFNPGPLDLENKLDNQVALLKLQADLSGEPVIGIFPGKAWLWIPGENNIEAFHTYGVGASRLEYNEEEQGWRFYHREVLLYTDPATGEVIDTWNNPVTGMKVRVVHVLNDPVQRFYPLEKGPFAPPYPYLVNGDNLVFQLDVFRPPVPGNNPLTRKEYPLHSQQDVYQTGELWAIHGSLAALNNPENTRVPCHTAWGRISMWEPFFEMGNRPGVVIYHSQAFTTQNGVDDIDPKIRKYLEKNHPQFVEAPYAPTEWGEGFQENHWTYAKKLIDQARADGKTVGESVFGIFD